MILIDSSVWIDYFRGTITAQIEKLDSLLGVEFLATGDLILTELVVELGGQQIAIQAARNFRALRCIESWYALLHEDWDFDPFTEHLGLRVVI